MDYFVDDFPPPLTLNIIEFESFVRPLFSKSELYTVLLHEDNKSFHHNGNKKTVILIIAVIIVC